MSNSIPHEISNLKSLSWIRLTSNLLTGTLPDIFESMHDINWLNIGNNKLSGSIPDSLWNINSLHRLIITNNNLVGSVPDDFCSKIFLDLEVDYSTWFLNEPKVSCECCGTNSECHFWELSETSLPCPKANTYPFDFSGKITITDHFADVTKDIFNGENVATSSLCLSPTGCYSLEFETGLDTQKIDMNYKDSSKALFRHSDCEEVNICGTSFDWMHPKRKGLNHLTQLIVPDLTETDSPKYQALCWIMTEDNFFDEYDICDGTLLQRFALVSFYFSYGLEVDRNKLASSPTCQWPGIRCDIDDKFMEHLDLSNSNLEGEIGSELGLLVDQLKTIDLSGNNLRGTIDPNPIRDIPNLEVFRVGNNMFAGQLSESILQLPKLKEFNMSNNLLTGTLPRNIAYSKSLGK